MGCFWLKLNHPVLYRVIKIRYVIGYNTEDTTNCPDSKHWHPVTLSWLHNGASPYYHSSVIPVQPLFWVREFDTMEGVMWRQHWHCWSYTWPVSVTTHPRVSRDHVPIVKPGNVVAASWASAGLLSSVWALKWCRRVPVCSQLSLTLWKLRCAWFTVTCKN